MLVIVAMHCARYVHPRGSSKLRHCLFAFEFEMLELLLAASACVSTLFVRFSFSRSKLASVVTPLDKSESLAEEDEEEAAKWAAAA